MIMPVIILNGHSNYNNPICYAFQDENQTMNLGFASFLSHSQLNEATKSTSHEFLLTFQTNDIHTCIQMFNKFKKFHCDKIEQKKFSFANVHIPLASSFTLSATKRKIRKKID